MIKNCKNINKRKGFTLIELLAVIVILAVIALIATPLILNIVNDTRKNAAKDSAYGYIKAIENKVALSALENKTYEDKERYAYNEIKANVKGKLPTGGLYTLKKGIVTKGTFCIDGFTISYENSIAKVERNGCTSDDLKLPGSVKLSSNSGIYKYPNSGTFEVIENISGGALSCTSENTAVATCSISGTTVTVVPGTTEGNARLTIYSAETEKYNKGQAVHLAITSKETLLSYTANDYNGVYDGKEHGITVEASGATITYSTDETNYSSENPKYINVGEYKVYYKIEKEGYKDITGSRNVTITKANGSIIAPTAKSLTYNGEKQELVNAGSASSGITLQYKVDDGAYTNIVPSRKDPGTYTVYYRGYGDSNHNHIPEKSLTVTINKATIEYSGEGYSGTYDGKEHGIIVEASGATITYSTDGTNYSSENPKYINVGEYKVYYKIEREGYNTATGSKTVKITKANNTLKLSSNSGNYTYPNSGTFEVTENISGGALSCTSNNTKVATCTIKDNIVTVTPGTTEGNATLTIKSAETENYNEAQVAYVATTEEGLLSYTALDYSGTYDGKEHGITVEASGATIKYGTKKDDENNIIYDLNESPTYTNAGTYMVYYQVTKTGYKTVAGSKKVVIIPSSPVITASDSKTSGDWHNTNFTLSFSGTGYPSGIYYYYGTTENPSTRGSSVAISSETSGTTYYVKACTSDNNCSDVSNYNVKLDKTAPTINSPFSSNGLTKIMLSTNEIKEVYINNVAVNINVNDDRSGISTSKIDSCSSKKPEIAKYNENGNNKYFQMIKISDSSDKFPIAEISCTVNATDNAGNKSSKKFTSFIGNGWVVEADKWYYYNGGGKVTGWSNLYWTRQESSGEISEGYRWYYTDSVTGEMYIGWHKLEWNNVTSWYYFAEAKRADANGTSAATTIYKTKDEPIYVGEMISGWIKERSTGCWYYTNEAGRMIRNQTNYSIDGKSYSFRSSGRCYSGSGCNSTCK